MKSTASKTIALTAFVALAICGISAPAQANQCDPLVRSAQQLVGLLTSLKEDFRRHYVHTPKFRDLMQDSGDMRKSANHILEIAGYRNVSIQHLEADVAEIDRLSHKLHSLVDRNEQKRNGHVHGNTKHTHQMLASMTNIIHTMQQQIQVLKQPVRYGHGRYSHVVRPQAPVYQQPVYNQLVYQQPVYSAPVANYAPQPQCNVRQPSVPAYTSHQGRSPVYSNGGIAAYENTSHWYRGR